MYLAASRGRSARQWPLSSTSATLWQTLAGSHGRGELELRAELGVAAAFAHQVQRESLGRFFADAGQAREVVHQSRKSIG
jgi:hypothetical protein